MFIARKNRTLRALCFSVIRAAPQLRYFANPGYCKPFLASLLARISPPAYAALFKDLPLCRQPEYCGWLLRHYPRERELRKMGERAALFPLRPLISIITPVYNSNRAHLSQAIESVLRQNYPHWELCIVDDASSEPFIRQLLEQYAAAEPRIKLGFHSRNQGISAASNTAIRLAQGEYIAQLDHDDTLAPHALWSVVAQINNTPEADIIYSDEDKLDSEGGLRDPFFKQDWCPDTFLSKMYTCHFGVYRRSLVEKIGGFRSEFDGAEDYDLVLRLSEHAKQIAHIPDILYHWRMHRGSIALGPDVEKAPALRDAGRRALQAALDRRGEGGKVEEVEQLPCHFRVRYAVRGPEKVRIIVLLDEHKPDPEFFERSTERNEVHFVRGGVTDRAGLFSDDAAYIAFLSSSLTALTPGWAERLMEQAQRPSVGAAGALAVASDGLVLHAGMIIGPRGSFTGSHRDAPRSAPGYYGQLQTITNYSALGHGCILCRSELCRELGGPDFLASPEIAIPDFCLRLHMHGHRNVYVPHVVARMQPPAVSPPEHEIAAFANSWRDMLDHDPCYNPHLSLRNADYRMRVHDR